MKKLSRKIYEDIIKKQEVTIKNLAKSVAEGWCENARLREKIDVLERAQGD